MEVSPTITIKHFKVRQYLGNKKAFVTLLSVIILTAASAIIITTNILLNVDSNIMVATAEQSKLAKALADTCAEKAIDKLKTNLAYTGNETINIGQSSCTISTITGTGNSSRTFTTTGTNRTVIKKVSVTIATVNPLTNITTWSEIQ